MNNILKNRNTLIVSLSLTVTVFLYSFINNTSLAPALLFALISAILIIIKSTPKTIYSVGLTILQALAIASAVQQVLLPIAQGLNGNDGSALYLVYGIVLQLLGFILFPLAGLLMYRFTNGRTWVNLLLTFALFDIGLFLAISDMGNFALAVLYPTSALILSSAIITVKHFIIKKKAPIVEMLKTIIPEKSLKVLNAKNIQPLKEGSVLLFSINKKDYKVVELEGDVKVSSSGIFQNNKDITYSINDSFKNSRKINVIINDTIKEDIVSKVKAYSETKPDGESNDVYFMNSETFNQFLDK